jgi:hypothetical protein
MIKKIIKKIKVSSDNKENNSFDAFEKQIEQAYNSSMSETHKKGYQNLKKLIAHFRIKGDN